MPRVSRTETAPGEGGFTLLEILVALAIFVLASVIAYRGLDSVTSTKSALDKEIRFWRELGLVFDRMEADFLQSVPRPLRDAPELLSTPLRGGNIGNEGESRGFFIELIRQDENRAQVRVFYLCQQQRLMLRVSAMSLSGAGPPGVAQGEAVPGSIDTLLLQAVEACDTAFLGTANAWLEEWPGDQALARPRAIRIRLALAGQGAFERVFHMP
jgi:general secretion pathway protein J